MHPEKYFKNLGYPRGVIRDIDRYRYKVIYKYLLGKSVLDVGTYYGDFLKMSIVKYKVYGTDINSKRVELANQKIVNNTVVIDFKDGKLHKFRDKSIDTVVCMEVIEHVYDDVRAIKELKRVARLRVIITLPFNEEILKEVCIHCGEETPRSGHLHSYNLDNINEIEKEIGIKFKKRFIGFRYNIINKVIFSLKNYYLISFLEKILYKLFKVEPKWLLLIMDI